jgi:DNA-binding transcriptional LysR family regulator
MPELIELRLLRSFLAICQAPSLAAASVRLNLSQPALSKHVAALERVLGQDLLERHARGVRPTEAGRALEARAEGLLRHAEQVAAEVGQSAHRMNGEVAIGVVSSLRGFLIAPTVAQFLRQHSDVRVRILEGTSQAMRDAVIDGRADLAVIAARDEAKPLVLRRFAGEPLLAVAPPSAKLVMTGTMPLSELGPHPLVLTTPPNSIRTTLDLALARGRVPARIVAEVESAHMAIDLVRLRVGWSVFPYSAVSRALAEREVSAAPMRRLTVTWAIATPRGQRASRAALALADAVTRTSERLIATGAWQTAVTIND